MRTSTKVVAGIGGALAIAIPGSIFGYYESTKGDYAPVYADINFGTADAQGHNLDAQKIANEHGKLPAKVRKAAQAITYTYTSGIHHHYVGSSLRVQKNPDSRKMITVLPSMIGNAHNAHYCGDALQKNGFDNAGGWPESRSRAGLNSIDGSELMSLATQTSDGETKPVTVAKIAKNAPKIGQIMYIGAYSEADNGLLRSGFNQNLTDGSGEAAIYSGVFAGTTNEGYEAVIVGANVSHSYVDPETTDAHANSIGGTAFNSNGEAVGMIEGVHNDIEAGDIQSQLGVNMQPDNDTYSVVYLKPLTTQGVDSLISHADDLKGCVNKYSPDLGTFPHINNQQ